MECMFLRGSLVEENSQADEGERPDNNKKEEIGKEERNSSGI